MFGAQQSLLYSWEKNVLSGQVSILMQLIVRET